MSIVHFSQIKMARSALGWSTQKLSEESEVSSRTLNRMETLEGFSSATKANLSIVKRTFEEAGIEFIGSADEGPGVRLWKR
jgi:ribosome-binding protein aMBF1 (putative translation factor)